MFHWKDLIDRLVDKDGDRLSVDRAVKALAEFRATDGIQGVFFDRLGLAHEDPDDASTWGPASPNDVDWTGFPEGEGIRMTTITPEQAWQGFVGAQTPEEFLAASRAQGYQTVEDAVAAYTRDLPHMFDDWDPATDLEAVADLLAQYIRQHVSE